MVKYLRLTNKEKFDILASVAKSKGLSVCEGYMENFNRYPYFSIDLSRLGGNNIWGQGTYDDDGLITFEQMVDLLLEYNQEHEYHLSNFTKVVYKIGNDFVKINNDEVDIAAIKNMISIINSLNH